MKTKRTAAIKNPAPVEIKIHATGSDRRNCSSARISSAIINAVSEKESDSEEVSVDEDNESTVESAETIEEPATDKESSEI